MKKAEAEFRSFLARKDMRRTAERVAILRDVLRRKTHFEADDVYTSLKRKGKKVSLASVFRTIPLLVEAGFVRKTPCDHMHARYESVYESQHHDHLVCVKCGRVIEFKDDAIEELQERVAKKYRFAMSGHRLILSGLCRECQGKRDNDLKGKKSDPSKKKTR